LPTRRITTSEEYVVTIEDPTVWTKAWTVKEEFTKQNDQDNRLYTEPRCVEGTTVSLGSFTDDARKSAPLQRDEVLIRRPGTP